MFPYESIPDGAVFAPHHLFLGVLIALAVCRVVRDDDEDREPWIVTNALYGALVGFGLTWRWFPVVGAGLTLTGLAVASGALARPFWRQARYRRVHVPVVAVGLAVAWDDALEHSFGLPTPLDWAWANYLYPIIT